MRDTLCPLHTSSKRVREVTTLPLVPAPLMLSDARQKFHPVPHVYLTSLQWSLSGIEAIFIVELLKMIEKSPQEAFRTDTVHKQ